MNANPNMHHIDEYRDPEKARALIRQINGLKNRIALTEQRPLQLMEFCGGHTHTIFRYGIEQMLPDWIELVHGPGCPVCVLPRGRVDDCVAIASKPGVIFTTFGDAMRVPGSSQSLIEARAAGADVRMVYSALDALQLAKQNPDREVVFFALGFETTMPGTALTILQAAQQDVSNFSVLCHHITTPPTIAAILQDPAVIIDGFLAPGHVSMVIGEKPMAFVAEQYRRPIVISGFEPLDILQSLWMLVQQLAEGRAQLENQYARVVREDGNRAAQDAIARVYEMRDDCELRGLGSLEGSGVGIWPAFARFDAQLRFGIRQADVADPSECQCADVLKGAIKPWQCGAFGRACTPATPLGALMVSSEGACAAYHQYGDLPELLRLREPDEQNLV